VTKRRNSSELDLTEAQLLYRKLREAFSTESFAAESQQAITQICDRALLIVDDDYCQRMFCEVDSYAQRLVQTGRRNPATIRAVLDAIQHRLGSLQMLRSASTRLARSEATLAKY